MSTKVATQSQGGNRHTRSGRKLMMIGLLATVISAGFIMYLNVTARQPTDADIRADLIAVIREAAPRERLEKEIASALDQDAPEQAEEYIEVVDLIGVPIDPALRTRLAEETSGWRAAARTTRRAAKSFMTGEGEAPVGIAAALASDLTMVGDVRDLAGQASRMLKGETVDELTLGLSMAGLAMTAGTVVTAGGALPAKVGISLAKLARKMGKLTVKFQAELGRLVSKAVNMPGFREAVRDIPWYRVDELASAARRHAAAVNTNEVQRVLTSVGEISKVTTPAKALRVLSHVDDVNDLQNAERAAKVLGKPVSGALRLTGKKVLATVAHATKISAAMIGAVIAAVLGALSFLFGALTALIAVLRLGRLARWIFRSTVGRLVRPRAQASSEGIS
ncbi:hypothetical protein [Azospirillum sp. TSO5]|uniref:hypothetical protein n=1 Tax=Azospirillum sp. TSO5 TaxID=716760 RepID=UPI0011B234D6|nr:hypothetical protein [Azospirillum sp. TSO5]